MAGRTRRARRGQPSPPPLTAPQTAQTQTSNEEPNNTQPVVNHQILDEINVEDNTSSDSESETTFSTSKSKPKIQVFKGIGDKVKIENWLKRFEMLSNYFKWSEKTKVVMMGNYLEDDALNWYIENCSDNYSELKIKLNNRFGLETVEPIIEFVNHRYDVKTGIKDYFETKRRYGVAAKLTESQMIPLMINNLPQKMVECFTAVKPQTFAEFYQIAKTAENNFKRNSLKLQFFNEKSNKSFESTNNKPKRKPPNPCKICEGLGFKKNYHWMSDCRNKSKTNPKSQTNPQIVNSIESQSIEEMPENDIRNINLN